MSESRSYTSPITARRVLAGACILGAWNVMAGAFGAHGLEHQLTEVRMENFQTATTYSWYHTIALLITGILILIRDRPLTRLAAVFFTDGIILFSGSLWWLSIEEAIFNVSIYSKIALITPLGGLLFIIGWGLLGISILKS